MLLNVPSLIAWSHFLQYKEYNLPSDPSQVNLIQITHNVNVIINFNVLILERRMKRKI